MCNKLVGRSIESVGQAVGVRSVEVQTNHVRSRHCSVEDSGVSAKQPRGTELIGDAEAGVPYSTAGQSVVWG